MRDRTGLCRWVGKLILGARLRAALERNQAAATELDAVVKELMRR
ncbi:hypothetical protein [Pacificitalea manganoxidans]|mgnify:CR=1 FL=1|nr:hypothetical protein [Pacificitalea manganoxidans]MDR6307948.1 hypothetical protein [Pacificitalea manganoxidans]|tara:strand:- start:316 stop:450 length:135 start_codon:yes stop_codon:yes gene_type:complete